MMFDSLTDLQSSQTKCWDCLRDTSLIPLLIYKALKRNVRTDELAGLIPLLIYKALKRSSYGRINTGCLIPLLIYKALKRR